MVQKKKTYITPRKEMMQIQPATRSQKKNFKQKTVGARRKNLMKREVTVS